MNNPAHEMVTAVMHNCVPELAIAQAARDLTEDLIAALDEIASSYAHPAHCNYRSKLEIVAIARAALAKAVQP